MALKGIMKLQKNDLTRAYSRSPLFSTLIRLLFRDHLTILTYHEIEPDFFSGHLKFLQKHYSVVSLSEVRRAFLKKDKHTLPPFSLLITFDDGWKSDYHLLPVLRRYQCRITIFIVGGLVNTNRRIWNFVKDLSDDENHWLKAQPNEKKNQYLEEVYDHHPEKEYYERSVLNLTEIVTMMPYVDFQSHTMFHPLLSKCSNSELIYELSASKKRISQIIGDEVYAIAYPYGDAGQRERQAAHAAGYQIGRVSGSPGLNRLEDSDPMALQAITVGAKSSTEDLKMQIARGHVRTLLSGLKV
jgi:peptidoglycan/xylan/chitin deacetylase (PgdA/CDA1 family)